MQERSGKKARHYYTVLTLVVESCGDQIERRHQYRHEHAAYHAAQQSTQEFLVLGQQSVFDERFVQYTHGAQLCGRRDPYAHHCADGPAPQSPDHAVIAVQGQETVYRPDGVMLMADRNGFGGKRLQVNF